MRRATNYCARAVGRVSWNTLALATLAIGLKLPTYAQQGSSQSVSLPTRLLNGHSRHAGVINRESDTVVVFVSEATNLLPDTPPNTVYVQSYGGRGSSLTALRAPYPALSARATVDASGQLIVAAHFRLSSGADVIGVHRQGDWRWYDAPNLIDFEVSNRGEVYLLQRLTDAARFSRIEPDGRRIVIRDLNRAASALSISDDGRAALVAWTDGTNTGTYLRMEYSDAEGRVYVAEAVERGGFTVVSRDGTMIAGVGTAARIQPEGSIVRVLPTGIRFSGTAIDCANDQIAYLTNQGELRVIDTRDRVDIPIMSHRYQSQRTGSRILDGGKIVFTAADTRESGGVVPGDKNLFDDVFIFDVSALQVTGVTVGSQPVRGMSSEVAVGYGSSLVAFTSDSRDLVAGKTTQFHDVFVALGNRVVRLMGSAEPNESSYQVSVSRWAGSSEVVFASAASNLVSGDTNGFADVFRWSASTQRLECITCMMRGGDSYAPVVAQNGIYFLSAATSHIPQDVPLPQAFRWQNGVLTLITLGNRYFESVERVVASPAGNWVALTARLSEAEPYGVYLFDGNLQLRQVLQASADLYATDVANNGTVVVHTRAQLLPGVDRDNELDVYAWVGGRYVLVSLNPVGSKGNGASFDGRIDASGRYVSFTSAASNLVPLDLNRVDDVFVYDLREISLYCVTRNLQKLPAGGSLGQISGDGAHVVFATGSADLVWMPLSDGVFVALHQLGCTPPGDVNLDGRVNDLDLLAVVQSFGINGPSLVDITVDEVVNDLDLLGVLTNFGRVCSFSWAGDGGGSDGSSSAPYVVRDDAGRAVLYYPSLPECVLMVGESVQLQEIAAAVDGYAAYPVAGGIFNLWREAFGHSVLWSEAERVAFRSWLEGEFDGDFQPTSGRRRIEPSLAQFQLSIDGNNYVRFKPQFWIEGDCSRRIEVGARANLDLRVLGRGQDGLVVCSGQVSASSSNNTSSCSVNLTVSGNNRFAYTDSGAKDLSYSNNSAAYTGVWFAGSRSGNIFGLNYTIDYRVEGSISLNPSLTTTRSVPRITFGLRPALDARLVITGGAGGKLLGVSYTISAEPRYNPFLRIELPASVSVQVDQQPCQIAGNASVRLSAGALAGYIHAAITTPCTGGLFCFTRCRSGERKDIQGKVPAYCCDRCRIAGWKRRVEIIFELLRSSGATYNNTLYERTLREPIK